MKVALFGYGRWGKKLYQVLEAMAEEVLVVDPREEKIKQNLSVNFVAKEFVLADQNFSYVFIATPEETHYHLVKECLNSDKQVFVEKPLTLSTNMAKELIELAFQKKLCLYVDYIFLLDPAFHFLQKKIELNEIGNIKHIDSYRYSVGVNKDKIQVTDDLLIHDLYLARILLDQELKIEESFNQSLPNSNNQSGFKQTVVKLNSGKQSYTGYYSWDANESERKLIVRGEKGVIVWEKTDNLDLISQYHDLNKKPFAKKVIIKEPQPLESSVKKFLSLVKNEKKQLKSQRYAQYQADIKMLELAHEKNPSF